MNHRTSTHRCLLAVVAAGAVAAALASHLVGLLPRLTGPVLAPDDAVAAGLAALGALAAGRLALGALLLIAEHLAVAGGRARPRLTAAARAVAPALLRRVVTVGVATGLGLAGAGGAVAVEPDLGWVVTTGSVAATVPVTGPAVAPVVADQDPPVVSSAVAPGPAATTPTTTAAIPASAAPAPAPAPAPTPVADTVVVAPGDTLWALTAARLAPGSGPADVAAAWPAVHAANRAVVGADPDVIHPGQVLDLSVLGEQS